MDIFFRELFDAYPASSSYWQYYEQQALKVCIKYTNTTSEPRVMMEYRSGFDGKTEVDPTTSKPKLLVPGATRYIAIEPSNKTFKYEGNHWGAAAYPKDMESAKSIWTPLNTKDIPVVLKNITHAGLVIPYFQIADTLCSLYPDVGDDQKFIARKLKIALQTGDADMAGFGHIITIMKSNAKVLGHMVRTVTGFPTKHNIFPMGYGQIPIKKGCLIIIDLDMDMKLKTGDVKYMLNGEQYRAPIIARLIDAPAVKGAMWTQMVVPATTKKRIPTLIRKAKKILTLIQPIN